jgi:branched-chain amino acid transport system permease protein
VTILGRIPRDYFILVGLVLALLTLPNFLNQFQLSIAILILYWALLGAAWNLMGGYAGQFSFGHAAFYGIGAYTSTMLLTKLGLTPWLGMLAGAGLAGLFGIAMGYLTFRYGLKGPYFALATFAFAELLRLISSELRFINTSIGIHLPLTGGDSWWRLQFEDSPQNYFYAITLLFFLGYLIKISLVHSKLGYYLQAIREDEEAAAALGVNLMRYKVTAVAISGALTAIGGSFFAQYFFFISPELVFGVPISIDILLGPIIGGTGTIWGPLVGALFVTPLGELTRALIRTPPGFLSFIEGRSGLDVMLFGAILIAVILFMPNGIVGLGKRLWLWVKR